MQTSSTLLRISPVVGLLFVSAIGFGFCQYGPGAFACVKNFYRVQTPEERREAVAKTMMKHVSNPKYEMSEEMRRIFNGEQADFDDSQTIGIGGVYRP